MIIITTASTFQPTENMASLSPFMHKIFTFNTEEECVQWATAYSGNEEITVLVKEK